MKETMTEKVEENYQEIYPAAKMYYYAAGGNHAYTITMQATLTIKIDEDKLRKAVKKSMEAFPVFLNRAVVVDRKLCTVKHEGNEPVFPETNCGRSFGTEETNGYMFYVTYDSSTVYLRVFHGLTDGKASHMFLSTLLRFYFEDCGVSFKESVKIKEAFARHVDSYGEVMAQVGKGRSEYKSDMDFSKFFTLPEQFYSEEVTSYRLLEISIPLEPLLKAAKKNGSSVAPYLTSLIGETLREQYDVNEKIIVTYLPCDLRQRFPLETGENASSIIRFPYVPELDHLSREERTKKLNGQLKEMLKPENLYDYIAVLSGTVKEWEKAPAPVEMVSAKVSEQNTVFFRETLSYLLSYLGAAPVPDELMPYVESFRFVADPYLIPLSFNIAEYKGTVRMMVSTFFENVQIVEEIYHKIKADIPQTFILDHGVRAEDAMQIERLQHFCQQDEMDKNHTGGFDYEN